MAPQGDKIADKAAPKKLSNILDDNACRTARIKKPASKAQLNARFELGSSVVSRQAFKNDSRRRRRSSLSPLLSSRSLSLSSFEDQEMEFEDDIEDLDLDN
jgi:hypothetical protein